VSAGTQPPDRAKLPPKVFKFVSGININRDKVERHLRGEPTDLAKWVRDEIDRLRGDQ